MPRVISTSARVVADSMQLQKLSALELTGILGIAYASWRVLVFMAKLVAAARIPSRVYEKLPSAASDSHSANRTVVELSAPPTARSGSRACPAP